MTSAAQQVGSYLLSDMVAQTGLAAVYRALPRDGGPAVALKVFHSYFGTEPGIPEAFLAGMAAVRTLRHPNILPVLDAGQDGPALWAALPWCDGTTLRYGPQPPYPLPVAAALIGAIAAALTAAHAQGIFHRNLKPNNVWVLPDGRVLLADFGVAVLGERASPLMRTHLHTPLPGFMSPEQAAGDPVDATSETYALGALFYWMLTGRPPFGGDMAGAVYQQQSAAPPRSPSHLNPALTRDVDATVLRALSPYPAARTRTPAALAEQVAALAAPADAAQLAAFFGGAAPQPDDRPARWAPEPTAGHRTPAAPGTFIPGEGFAREGRLASWQEPEQIERTFERVWKPQERRPVRDLARAALIAALIVLPLAWWVRPYLVPPEPLPPPSTLLAVVPAPGVWPMGGFDPGRTAAAPALAAPPRGELRWSYATGPDPIMAAPVADADTVYLPAGSRRLLALNASDGTVRWELPTTGPVDSTPALAGGLLFYGQRDGNVLAVDTADGSVRWRYQTGGPVLSSPVVADGALFIGSGDSRVYCLDAATGQLRWTYQTGSWVTSSPAVVDGMVVVGSRDGWVTYLDANNGAFLFHFFAAGGIEGGAAVMDGTVYVGSESRRFWALDTAARSAPLDRQITVIHAQLFIWGMAPPPPPPKGLRWSNRSPGRFIGMPAVGPDLVYAGVVRANLRAAPSGAVAAQYPAEGTPFRPVWDGVLHAWDRVTGARRWEFVTLGSIYSSPALAGDTLYVGSNDHRLYALDAATGAVRWSFETGGEVRSSPAVAAHGVYVGAYDGVL